MAIVPRPLGGTLPDAVPSEADLVKERELRGKEGQELLHMEDKRFLQYGIIAGRPIGPLSSHMPQDSDQIETQEQARREDLQAQKTVVMKIDLQKG